MKLGALLELLEPVAPVELLPLALGVEELLLELGLELLPDALGVLLLGELELLLGELELPPDADDPLDDLSADVALGVELLPEELELCATATLDRAKSAAAVAALMSFRFIRSFLLYLLVPEEVLLPPEPMLLPPGDALLPLPDDAAPLGTLLPDDDVPLLGDDVAPLEAPLEPDLLKCASHSLCETCPSLFVSTSEKLGIPAAADADAVDPLAPLEPGGLELWASAVLASAKSATAVAEPTTLSNIKPTS